MTLEAFKDDIEGMENEIRAFLKEKGVTHLGGVMIFYSIANAFLTLLLKNNGGGEELFKFLEAQEAGEELMKYVVFAGEFHSRIFKFVKKYDKGVKENAS